MNFLHLVFCNLRKFTKTCTNYSINMLYHFIIVIHIKYITLFHKYFFFIIYSFCEI
nr:MAG TPA: hypothetical protein [Caudoviricetes sp.]